MIIIGIPRADEMDNYYIADDRIAFILEQAGFHARYFDEGAHYYRLNKKLIKKLSDLGIEV